jgi:hypothetical protein
MHRHLPFWLARYAPARLPRKLAVMVMENTGFGLAEELWHRIQFLDADNGDLFCCDINSSLEPGHFRLPRRRGPE